MEDVKNQTVTDVPTGIPQLTPESIAYLLKIAKWGKFLAILGFIIAGLMVVAGILMSFVLNMVHDDMVPLNMPFSPKLLSIFYVAIAAIYLIPVSFLNTFSNNAIKAIKLSSTEKMTTSIKNLKNLFVFLGISTIVILALYTIGIIAIGTAAFFNF